MLRLDQGRGLNYVASVPRPRPPLRAQARSLYLGLSGSAGIFLRSGPWSNRGEFTLMSSDDTRHRFRDQVAVVVGGGQGGGQRSGVRPARDGGRGRVAGGGPR